MRQLAAMVAACVLHLALARPALAQEVPAAPPSESPPPASEVAWSDDGTKWGVSLASIALGAGLAVTAVWVLATDGSCLENEGELCVRRQEFDDWFLGWNVAQLVLGVAGTALGIWAATLPVAPTRSQASLRVTPRIAVSERAALAGLTIEF